MYTITELQIFLRTASTSNLSEAARQLQITPSAASAALFRLETSLQVKLFSRSTRAMQLTAEGEMFRDHCEQALGLLAKGEQLVKHHKQALSGELHLSVPTDVTRTVLMPWLDQFLIAHPKVHLVIHATDKVQDILNDRIHLALRYGHLPDSGLQARQLHHGRRILAAAPAYLQTHDLPKHPNDLAKHQCITFFTQGQINDRWKFFSGAEEIQVKVNSHRSADDSSLARLWAVDGQGLVYKSSLELQPDIDAGRLQLVLPDFGTEAHPLSAVYADAKYLPARVRALLDFLIGKFGHAN